MSRSAIYAYGFDGNQAAVEAAVVALGLTPFNVVLLPSLHVGPGGELALNNVPVERLSRALEPDRKSGASGKSAPRRAGHRWRGPE
jgi:hypothetical protein